MSVRGILMMMLAEERRWRGCEKKRAIRMIRGFGAGERRDVHDGCHNLHDQSCVVLRVEQRDMGTDRRSCPIEA